MMDMEEISEALVFNSGMADHPLRFSQSKMCSVFILDFCKHPPHATGRFLSLAHPTPYTCHVMGSLLHMPMKGTILR
jgi:hypothetical protein